MKKALKIFIPIILLLCLLYYLFQPVLMHNIGRSTFEDLKHFIALGTNGNILWSNTIGYANLESKKLADSSTQYRIGSTSKAVTSVGLGMLLQKDKLQLHSLVKDFVPYASDELSNLTLKQLASHTSGIRNYGTCVCFPIWEYYNRREHASITESISVFNGDDLLFKPGSGFSYSSYNFTLLSAMIEKAAKEDFLSYMNNTIFKPLHMHQTAGDGKSKILNATATFYDVENASVKEAYSVNNSNKWAGGGFVSTPKDLVRLGNAVLENQLLNAETKSLLFEPVTLDNGTINIQNYALGWRNDTSDKVFTDKRPVTLIHHGGVAMGSTAILILVPEYHTTIALTMNKTGSVRDLSRIAYKLINLFIN